MTKVVILVSGGCVQNVLASEPVVVRVIDSDNLRAEGKSWPEIEVITQQAEVGTQPVKF